MTFEAAIWASSTALTTKVALAAWTAACLLICYDQRRMALRWQLGFQLLALLTIVSASLNASHSDLQWLWRASGLLAILCAALSFRRWLNLKPSELHEEAAAVDAPLKKSKKSAKSVKSTQLETATGILPMTLNKGMHLIGWGVVVAAVAIAVHRAAPGSATVQWLGVMHVVASSVLLGVALSCAVELTFGAAPRALSQVHWLGFGRVALVCCIVELLVGAVILTSVLSERGDLNQLIISRLFAISFLLIDLIAWIIPHRVATFQRTGKSHAWVSLTLAAWLAVLTLVVLMALPSNWPWELVG